MTVTLAALGWPHHRASIDAAAMDPGLLAALDGGAAAEARATARPARVTLQGTDAWHVHDGTNSCVARARRRDLTPTPVTGDWVVLVGDGRGGTYIEAVLPRRTALSRAEAGGRSAEQVVASNIDVVAIVTSVDTVNPRRLERELTAAWGSGARPMVVVTKTDLVAGGELVEVLAAASGVAVGVEVVAVSSHDGTGVEDVAAVLSEGTTLALVGPSGVGKSSLVNALAGEDVMATTEVRGDRKGRHTTTTRALVVLPAGGLVLDTPGMREFAPWNDDGLDDAFADLAVLAADCRFADCSHEHEPSCAVRAAAAADPAVAARLDSWRALQRELAWLERRRDARLQAIEGKKWASLTREARGRARPQTR